MKTLVVEYSRDGHTGTLGLQLARTLKADFDIIKDLKKRKGIIAYIFAGWDALKGSTTKISYSKDPKKYDLVIIGTPVWAGRPTPAILTYLKKYSFKKIAFFCVAGGGKPAKTFDIMEQFSKKPLATLCLRREEVDNDKFSKELAEFCRKIK